MEPISTIQEAPPVSARLPLPLSPSRSFSFLFPFLAHPPFLFSFALFTSLLRLPIPSLACYSYPSLYFSSSSLLLPFSLFSLSSYYTFLHFSLQLPLHPLLSRLSSPSHSPILLPLLSFPSPCPYFLVLPSSHSSLSFPPPCPLLLIPSFPQSFRCPPSLPFPRFPILSATPL